MTPVLAPCSRKRAGMEPDDPRPDLWVAPIETIITGGEFQVIVDSPVPGHTHGPDPKTLGKPTEAVNE
jgi:hypothetical protein